MQSCLCSKSNTRNKSRIMRRSRGCRSLRRSHRWSVRPHRGRAFGRLSRLTMSAQEEPYNGDRLKSVLSHIMYTVGTIAIPNRRVGAAIICMTFIDSMVDYCVSIPTLSNPIEVYCIYEINTLHLNHTRRRSCLGKPSVLSVSPIFSPTIYVGGVTPTPLRTDSLS
jgi:hypothetical protein